MKICNKFLHYMFYLYTIGVDIWSSMATKKIKNPKWGAKWSNTHCKGSQKIIFAPNMEFQTLEVHKLV